MLIIRLHTEYPGHCGLGTTYEVNYRGYAPVTLPHTKEAWDVQGNIVSNRECLQFGVCQSAPKSPNRWMSRIREVAPQAACVTARYVSIGYSNTDTFFQAAGLGHPLYIVPGIQPQFSAGGIQIEINSGIGDYRTIPYGMPPVTWWWA